MKRKIIAFICVLIVAGLVLPPSAGAAPELSVDAKSAVIIEPTTGEVLFEQNADERLPLASVTKVMTILLIYDAISDGRIGWDDVVTVSDHAASMGGSQIFLEPNERQTVRDLTKSVVIASANDAAVAMAEFVAGSEESFVSMMNKRAGELGMKNSSFRNACGLDADGHFSSARDVAVMSRELVNLHPEVRKLSSIWQDQITHKTARGESVFGLTNTNKLLKQYGGAEGLKTGSTSKALYCLSGLARRGEMSLIAVVLASPSPTVRFGEVSRMFDYGFANFALSEGIPVGTTVGTVRVNKGQREEIDVVVKNAINAVTPKGAAGELDKEIIIYDSLDAPVLAGHKAGEIKYSLNGQNVGTSDLTVVEDVRKVNIYDVFDRLPRLWFHPARAKAEVTADEEPKAE
ncbi:MAG: D-alanyl-D-alanine carboxypeptidase [Clostridiales bacterium]|jgi:D-alanyl-D-alanine carboxypeptidase (penicillin-binding protein 5/6)|nr:D-alanyl-D-alanine carboxypeptidase [Clostridiales bacterium]